MCIRDRSITRVRWGGVRHSVNGIPTGTTYHIAFGDGSDVAAVELRNEAVYNDFTRRLWGAVCVRLMISYAEGLRAGKQYRFGDIVLGDNGCEVEQHKFLTTQRVTAPWADLRVWSSDGNVVVGLSSNNKAYGKASYKDTDNAHILEAMIRMFFKDTKARRVSDAILS